MNRTQIRKAVRPAAVLIAALWLNGAIAAPASANDAAERKDRTTFNKLVQQIRVARGKLEELNATAIAKARENDGKAPDVIKAQILAVQDEIDRKSNRLELITLRHGWEMPDLADADRAGAVGTASSREAVFGPVDRMLQRAMQREATQLASTVYLPVISNPVR